MTAPAPLKGRVPCRAEVLKVGVHQRVGRPHREEATVGNGALPPPPPHVGAKLGTEGVERLYEGPVLSVGGKIGGVRGHREPAKICPVGAHPLVEERGPNAGRAVGVVPVSKVRHHVLERGMRRRETV
mgnify:CR=1 FL=1